MTFNFKSDWKSLASGHQSLEAIEAPEWLENTDHIISPAD
jgi:hypothetical protein